MRITKNVYMVGSGEYGISSPGDCHVYLIDTDAGSCLIDAGCGDDPRAIVATMIAEGVSPAGVRFLFLTHAHRDHAGGCRDLVALLRREYGARAELVATAEEADLLANGSAHALGLDLLGLAGADRDEVLPRATADRILTDGEVIEMGGVRLTAVVVAGHNPACLCLLARVDETDVLFAGDVVLCGGFISLGNWPGSDYAAYRKSLPKLAEVRFEALLPAHFGWTLRGGEAHVRKAIDAFAGLWPPPNSNTRHG